MPDIGEYSRRAIDVVLDDPRTKLVRRALQPEREIWPVYASIINEKAVALLDLDGPGFFNGDRLTRPGMIVAVKAQLTRRHSRDQITREVENSSHAVVQWYHAACKQTRMYRFRKRIYLIKQSLFIPKKY